MLVVIASGYDTTAPQLAARLEQHGAVPLTCEDLSLAGWQWRLADPDHSTFVAGGKQIRVSELTGVLTRRPAIYEQELRHIVAADRAYVAAEMTAFLRSWLADLPCPVLNRPTPQCLSGPGWRAERWVITAAQLGMEVEPIRRHVTPPGDPPRATPSEDQPVAGSHTGVVVGDRCFGELPEAVKAQARRLAAAAGVDLLGVQFLLTQDGARFVGATLWPALTDPEVIEAVVSYLSAAPRRQRDASR